MKTNIVCFLIGALSVIAYHARARWLPWARTEEQRVVDALAKKASNDDSKAQP